MSQKSQKTAPKRVFAVVDAESKIHKTMEYDRFKRMPGNRAVRPGHVKTIKDKIEEHDLKEPILINKRFEIIDGQHTLEARRELALPVYYRFGEKMDLKDVQTLNNTKLAWTNDDYANSFIELGNKHYKIYRAFRKKYGFPHEVTIILLTGRDMRDSRKSFKGGDFRVADLPDAEKKADMVTKLRPYMTGFRQDVFVKALMVANSRDGFDFKRFLNKVEENRLMIQYWPKIDQNLLMIETIYNTGPGRKVPLRYQLTRPYSKKEDQEQQPEAGAKKANGQAGTTIGTAVERASRVSAS